MHELFPISESFRGLIARNAPINEINEAARQAGFKPMRYDGLKKVLRGLTTRIPLVRSPRYFRAPRHYRRPI